MNDRCKETVCGEGQWGSLHRIQCARTATKDGYCTIHHPDYKKAKYAAQKAKYEAVRKQRADIAEVNERERQRLAGLDARCASLESDLSAITKERDELKACLEALCDIQNGPPLIQDGPAWEAIMTEARNLIEAKDEVKK